MKEQSSSDVSKKPLDSNTWCEKIIKKLSDLYTQFETTTDGSLRTQLSNKIVKTYDKFFSEFQIANPKLWPLLEEELNFDKEKQNIENQKALLTASENSIQNLRHVFTCYALMLTIVTILLAVYGVKERDPTAAGWIIGLTIFACCVAQCCGYPPDHTCTSGFGCKRTNPSDDHMIKLDGESAALNTAYSNVKENKTYLSLAQLQCFSIFKNTSKILPQHESLNLKYINIARGVFNEAVGNKNKDKDETHITIENKNDINDNEPLIAARSLTPKCALL